MKDNEFGNYRYEYIKTRMTHDQHKKDAQKKGGNLVWISNEAENNFVRDYAAPFAKSFPVIWMGGERTGPGYNFKWTSSNQWKYNNWWHNQPDNWGRRGEDAVMMWLHDGQKFKGYWNDAYKNRKFPAVYKYLKQSRGEKGEKGKKGEKGEIGEKGEKGEIGEDGLRGERGLRGFNGSDGIKGDPGDTTPEFNLKVQQTKDNAANAGQSASIAGKSANDAGKSANDAEKSADDAITYFNDIQDLLNLGVSYSAYGHYGELTEMQTVLDNNNDSFSNIENFVENMSNADIIDDLTLQEYIQQEIIQTNENINREIRDANYMRNSEIITQNDDIVSKVLMDFMIDSQNGSNIEKVYEKLKQDKNDINRNNQIKTYYNKAYNEYIFILKVVICLIILLIPIIFLNKYEYIDNNKTLTSVVFIITIGVLFISYRLYLLYMKDDIDFDRIRVPYNRQANKLIKQGKMESKGSVFKNLGVTCIGDECCDVSMVYDNLNNKCILSENFGGYFDSIQNKNKEEINVIEPYKVENFTTIENLSHIKEGLLRESLIKSTNTRF